VAQHRVARFVVAPRRLRPPLDLAPRLKQLDVRPRRRGELLEQLQLVGRQVRGAKSITASVPTTCPCAVTNGLPA
jgi:hypothetical protein